MLYKKGALEKDTGVLPALIKERLRNRCFHENFAEFLRKPFLENISGQWLLYLTAFFTPHCNALKSVMKAFSISVPPKNFRKLLVLRGIEIEKTFKMFFASISFRSRKIYRNLGKYPIISFRIFTRIFRCITKLFSSWIKDTLKAHFW